LGFIEKKLQQTKKDNVALARYINARKRKEDIRRKEGTRNKVEEKARRKAMVVALTSDEGQSSKDVQTWRK
jgi:hypothetical protein